ncbi:MAG: hypothetical protein Q27BPR15_16855 [Rhodobacter sp. CACIA14H1]|nr:MAG: hypothetical protein Q27BPR15_16855 [Rhodobacter sp. CACIA14H1]
MQNLIRNRGRQGYAALALFLIVYLAALALVIAPKDLLTGTVAESAAQD